MEDFEGKAKAIKAEVGDFRIEKSELAKRFAGHC